MSNIRECIRVSRAFIGRHLSIAVFFVWLIVVAVPLRAEEICAETLAKMAKRAELQKHWTRVHDFVNDDAKTKKIISHITDPQFRSEVMQVWSAGGEIPKGVAIRPEAEQLGKALMGAQALYDHYSAPAWSVYNYVNRVIWTPVSKVRPEPPATVSYAQRYLTKTWRLTQSTSRSIVDQLLPVGIVFEYSSPERRAFTRLFFNPNYQPTEVEIKALTKSKVLQLFEDRRVYELANPVKARVVRYIHGAKNAATLIVAGAAVRMADQTGEHGPVTADDVEKDLSSPSNSKKYMLQDDELEVIVNAVPFPHMAIRIGNTVYSFYHDQIRTVPVADYLHGMQGLSAEEEKEKEKDKHSSMIVNSGLTPLSHNGSFEVVRIHLDADEVKKLRLKLNEARNPMNKNRTFVNDSALMVRESIATHARFNFVPGPDRFIDSSPGQMLMALSLQKASGNANVRDIYTVMSDSNSSFAYQVARNSAIHYSESRLFINDFLLNQIYRGAKKMLPGEKPDGVHVAPSDEEVKATIKKFQIEEDPKFKEIFKALADTPIDQRTQALINKLRADLNLRLAEIQSQANKQAAAEDADYADMLYVDVAQAAPEELSRQFEIAVLAQSR